MVSYIYNIWNKITGYFKTSQNVNENFETLFSKLNLSDNPFWVPTYFLTYEIVDPVELTWVYHNLLRKALDSQHANCCVIERNFTFVFFITRLAINYIISIDAIIRDINKEKIANLTIIYQGNHSELNDLTV